MTGLVDPVPFATHWAFMKISDFVPLIGQLVGRNRRICIGQEGEFLWYWNHDNSLGYCRPWFPQSS